MRELRRSEAGGFEDQYVFVGVRKMVLSANDVADAQVGVVGAGGQVIRGHTVGPQQGEVLDVGGGLYLLTIDGVGETNHLSALARHAKAQGKRLTRSGAAIAFLAR